MIMPWPLPQTGYHERRLTMSLEEEIKVDPAHHCHGLLETMQFTLGFLKGHWQYQVLGNLDELRIFLEGKLPPDQLAEFVRLMEQLVKNPFRRQIGRLKSISRSAEELSRYLSQENPNDSTPRQSGRAENQDGQ